MSAADQESEESVNPEVFTGGDLQGQGAPCAKLPDGASQDVQSTPSEQDLDISIELLEPQVAEATIKPLPANTGGESKSESPERKIQLGTPVQYVTGVGSQRALLLAKLGLTRAGDLLFHFPRDYQAPAEVLSFGQLRSDQRCSVVGRVVERELRGIGEGKSLLGVLLEIDGGSVRLLWFNQPYRIQQIQPDMKLQATGIIKLSGFAWEMVHPEIRELPEHESAPSNLPVPLYGLTEGIQNHHMRRCISAVVSEVADQVEEVLPESIRQKSSVVGVSEALKLIHQPSTLEEALRGRNRFIFQELLVLQLALAIRRRQRVAGLPSPVLEATGKIHNRILSRFPFELTSDQRRAIMEVGNDMGRAVPMNRLIQGDVGSGKTVIAQYAMLLAVAHGYQAALMAPTEVLARQHAKTLAENLRSSRVHVELLTGSLAGSERQRILDSIAMGTTDLVVGTQALLSDKLEFCKLGVVIVDEQHRFGVGQRASLRSGTETQPHYLVLTATPIPRTIAMTMFGDLDVSTLREKPPGRSIVKTYIGRQDEMASWWEFVRKQLAQGRQAYVVAPRVEGNDAAESIGAEQWHQRLSTQEFRDYRVDLLHGKMSPAEKEEALRKLNEHETDLLVSTTVIEVGIDVPNASVMTVMEADRLGLAQLHQLRGRVGRGIHPGYFCVFPRKDSLSEDNERLDALTKTQDGFELAETDFRIRGPGHLLGTKQHGLPPLRIADLQRDRKILELARSVAQELINESPDLERDDLRRLKNQVLKRYGSNLELGDVG
jgi:ATP-dependent DNA helicase RecG